MFGSKALGAPRSILRFPADVREIKRVFFCLIFSGMLGGQILAQEISPAAKEFYQNALRAADTEQKIRWLENAVQQSPQFLEARLELGKTLFQLGRHDQARAQLESALDIDAQNAEVWYWKGRSYHALGDTATAARSYRRALKRNPNLSAAKIYLTEIANQPQFEALYQTAEQARQARDWRRAAETYQMLLAEAPDFKDAAQKLNAVKTQMTAEALASSAKTPRPQRQVEDTTLLAATKDSSARSEVVISPPDSLRRPTVSTPANKPQQNFSTPLLIAAGAIIFISIIAFIFRQKRRASQQERMPAAGKMSPGIINNDAEKNAPLHRPARKAMDAATLQFGRYRLEEELGRGGMGRVHKAYDLKLERTVAIKIIRLDNTADGRESEERIMRFRREAKAIARLNHPNIVSLYDYDEADGTLYMVMEYVEGLSVEQMLNAQRQLNARSAVRMIKQVCWALDYAHKNGVIHRDLKPSNIMLNQEDVVKVVDFGVAKLLGASSSQMHTLTGMRLGSPFYMSPEQIEAQALDARSDIFSLGVVFYEMLAGQKPFTLNAGNSLSSLFNAILHNDPPKLQNVSPALEMIVQKMLAKDRERRFARAREIIEALGRLESKTSE